MRGFYCHEFGRPFDWIFVRACSARQARIIASERLRVPSRPNLNSQN